ncbi:MAG: hypothetical protein AAF604_04550 [Acidobacteriota bacterium]
MISDATLLAWVDPSASVATLRIFERGVVRDLEGWIPRYLGPVKTHTEILSGPGAARGRALLSLGEGRPSPLVLQEEIGGVGALLAVRCRSSEGDAWIDLDEAPWDSLEVDGRRLIRLGEAWPPGHRNLQVQYSFGFDEDQGPEDVTAYVLEAVRTLYQRRQLEGVSSEAIDGHRIVYDGLNALPQALVEVRNNLKRSAFGG